MPVTPFCTASAGTCHNFHHRTCHRDTCLCRYSPCHSRSRKLVWGKWTFDDSVCICDSVYIISTYVHIRETNYTKMYFIIEEENTFHWPDTFPNPLSSCLSCTGCCFRQHCYWLNTEYDTESLLYYREEEEFYSYPQFSNSPSHHKLQPCILS